MQYQAQTHTDMTPTRAWPVKQPCVVQMYYQAGQTWTTFRASESDWVGSSMSVSFTRLLRWNRRPAGCSKSTDASIITTPATHSDHLKQAVRQRMTWLRIRACQWRASMHLFCEKQRQCASSARQHTREQTYVSLATVLF